MWCGMMWCGVVWCGVVWCDVVWCGKVWDDIFHTVVNMIVVAAVIMS